MNKNVSIEEFLNNVPYNYKHYNDIIGFCNGTFDMLHPGHIKLLKECKENSDICVVGLNSDNSVKRYKGDKRPILNINERLLLLSSLIYVDYVIIFEEDTPSNIIDKIKPNKIFKGSDIKILPPKEQELINKHKIELILVDMFEGMSTSNCIDRILKAYKD